MGFPHQNKSNPFVCYRLGVELGESAKAYRNYAI